MAQLVLVRSPGLRAHPTPLFTQWFCLHLGALIRLFMVINQRTGVPGTVQTERVSSGTLLPSMDSQNLYAGRVAMEPAAKIGLPLKQASGCVA